jgi:hypothetical protein
MQALLFKAAPWLLLGGAVFGGIKMMQAKARAEGRIEVLVEQRDSVLAVHEEEILAIKDSVSDLQVQIDTVKVTETVLIDELLDEVTDTVLVERIRTVIDTIQFRCSLCETQVALLTGALSAEEAQHQITRNLLTAVRGRREGRISLGLTVTPLVYDVTGKQFRTGVFVSAGINIRIF